MKSGEGGASSFLPLHFHNKSFGSVWTVAVDHGCGPWPWTVAEAAKNRGGFDLNLQICGD